MAASRSAPASPGPATTTVRPVLSLRPGGREPRAPAAVNHRRGRGGYGDGSPGQRGQGRPWRGVQLSCRHHHNGARAEEGGNRRQQEPVEPGRGPGQLSLSPRSKRGIRRPVRQAAQCQPHVAQFVADFGGDTDPTMVAPARGRHHCMQFTVDIGQLNERRLTKGRREVAEFGQVGRRPAALRTRRLPGPLSCLPLELALAAQEALWGRPRLSHTKRSLARACAARPAEQPGLHRAGDERAKAGGCWPGSVPSTARCSLPDGSPGPGASPGWRRSLRGRRHERGARWRRDWPAGH